MWLPVIAVGLGVAMGALTRGRRRELDRGPFQALALLPAGIALQVVPEVVDVPAAAVWVVASHAALLAFAVLNVRHVGMGVTAVGLAANVVVIGANGAMPVRAEAVVAAGLATPEEVSTLDLGARRRLAQPGDALPFLGDVVPLPALAQVVSFGDLVVAAGVGNVALHLIPARRRPGAAGRPAPHGRLTPADR